MAIFRRTRYLLLLGALAVAVAVAVAFLRQRASQAVNAPAKPALLPSDTNAAASDWVYTKEEGGRTKVEVRARNFRHAGTAMDLEGVQLKLFAPDGQSFDLVRSAKASFDQERQTLYSEGAVDITMGLPVEGQKAGRLLSIRSSGVTFESATGKASTERAAEFSFDGGSGKCVGAAYDPNLRELLMRSQVELNWQGRGPKSTPMKIEAGELAYKERDHNVWLRGWSRLTRGGTRVEGGDSWVTLGEGGVIEKVESTAAHGTDRAPGRTLDYSAGHLWIEFAPKGEFRKLTGTDNARVTADTAASRTALASERIELNFEPGAEESTLKDALAMGKSVLESVPKPRKGKPTPETRILRSEVIVLAMQPGGQELRFLETHSPGRLEFIPNSPGQRRRTLHADPLRLDYGPDNTPRLFTASRASTRTEPVKKDDKPIETWSDDMKAEFDAQGEITRLEQWNNFRYREGERTGSADRAVMEQATGRVWMERNARFQDTAGTLAADRIDMAQQSGDVIAEGNVVSTRMPERKAKGSAMLTQDEPLEGRARRMTTSDKNQRILYEGNVLLWQGPNRLAADRVDIDRGARTLLATGNVRTRFLDNQKAPKGKAPGFVAVESESLSYREADRLAHYRGGVKLTRPGMDVKAREIRAFLNDSEAESSLHHALADGAVEIVRTQPGRKITGRSEHAEFYDAEQKVVLTQGQPLLEDSARGVTRGQELIYFAKDDKLLVNGTETALSQSRIRRSK